MRRRFCLRSTIGSAHRDVRGCPSRGTVVGMRRLPTVTILSAALVLGAPSLVRATAAEDQAVADAAIAAFNERMEAAGFVSEGPSDFTSGDEDGDEAFAKCELDFELLGALEDEEGFTGESARAFSDEFLLAPEDAPPTTDFLDFSLEEQRLAALVITVDEGSTPDLDAIVELIGSPEIADCIEQSLDEQMTQSADSDPPPLPEGAFELDVSTEADLGVGEASAGLTLGVEIDAMGFTLDLSTSLLFARVDRSLVGVLVGRSGPEVELPIDPVAELAALAAEIAAGA